MEIDIVTIWSRVGLIKLQTRWQGNRFTEYKRLASSQPRQHANQIALTLRYEAAHVALIVWVRYAQANERAALGKDRLGHFMRTLADDGKTNSVFAPFLCYSFH